MIRPRLYALLVDAPNGPRRRLFYRGEEHEETVPERIRTEPAETPVLLAGAPDRWDSGATPHFKLWNRPTISALREGQLTRKLITLKGVQGCQWALDSERRPCELGNYQSSDDGTVVVVNYAGWWLAVLEKDSIEVFVSRVGAKIYYIVPASAVDILYGASEPDPSHLTTQQATTNALEKPMQPVRAAIRPIAPAMPSTQSGTPVDRIIPIDEVMFVDGQIGIVLSRDARTWIVETRLGRSSMQSSVT